MKQSRKAKRMIIAAIRKLAQSDYAKNYSKEHEDREPIDNVRAYRAHLREIHRTVKSGINAIKKAV